MPKNEGLIVSNFFIIILFFSLNTFAAVKNYTGIGNSVTVSIDPIKNSDQFYLKINNTKKDDIDRVWIAKLTRHMNDTEEEYLVKGLDIAVYLSGRHANVKAKEPYLGHIMIAGLKVLLKADSRSEDLASEYAKTECLNLDKANAKKEVDSALAKMNAACSTSMTVALDWPSFNNSGLACNFRESLNALAQVCKDGDFKKAAAQLKTFKVMKGSETELVRSGSTVTVKISEFPINTELKAKLWFEENL